MTRKALVPFGVAAVLLAMASWSHAGDFHYGINLICSDCHVMHYSQQHGYNPNGTGNFTTIGGGGPYEHLLRNDVNDLCLSCHDGIAWAPDVFEGHSAGYVRQGGALNEVGGNGLYPPPTGHSLGSTDVAPGSSPAWSNPDGLNCADCHSPHGSTTPSSLAAPGGYRNLYNEAVNSITYSRGDVEGSNDLTKWVYEDVSSGVSTNHYGYNHLTFNEPDQTKSAYAAFCKGCHTNFHGDVGGSEIGGSGSPPEDFVRHPTNGANIGAVGDEHSSLARFAGKTNQVHVMSPTGVRAGSYTTSNTTLSPSCFSCHKGHGNQNAFGLIYMLGTGTVSEQGDAGADARNLCRQCHEQGGSSAAY